jgi:hypothetical protein
MIYQWAIENSLKRKNVKNMMLEAWRRVHMFHRGNVNENLIVLALPSQVKGLEDFLIPSSGLTPRVYNWFKLTSKGKQVINDLSSKINFSEKRHNQQIFNL